MFGRTRIIFYYKPDENIFGALTVKWWMSIKPAVAFLYCWAGLVIIWFMIYKCINVELKVAPSFFLCYQGLSQSFNFLQFFMYDETFPVKFFVITKSTKIYSSLKKILHQKRYSFTTAFICRSWRRSSVVTQKCYQKVFFYYSSVSILM